MKIISRGDDFTLFIINKFCIDLDNIKKYIKSNILKLKKRYRKDISGFYDVDVYINNKIGMILDFKKDGELDFFKDIIDVNVNICDSSKIYLKFDDIYLFNKIDKIYYYDGFYYIDIDEISLKEFYSILEFSDFIYGDTLSIIKKNLQLLKK